MNPSHIADPPFFFLYSTEEGSGIHFETICDFMSFTANCRGAVVSVLIVIRNVFIAFGGFYLFTKLTQASPIRYAYIKYLFCSAFLSAAVYAARFYSLPLSTMIMMSVFAILAETMFRKGINLSVVASVIACGISYGVFTVGVFLSLPVNFIIYFHYSDQSWLDPVAAIIAGVLQILLLLIVFNIPRLRSAAPILMQKGNSDVGVYISVSVFIMAILIGTQETPTLLYVAPVSFLFLAGPLFYSWWRRRITQTYIGRAKEREISELQQTLRDKDAEITYLKRHIDSLAVIIHKDNKIVPAMERALQEYLSYETPEQRRQGGQALLEHLGIMTKERAGIIERYEGQHRPPPFTGDPAIDGVLRLMEERAGAAAIDFDVQVTGAFSRFAERGTPGADLLVLLADLIENALNAVDGCETKCVSVHIDSSGPHGTLAIHDSGVPFDDEVLAGFGAKRMTTRADKGGSGIGLETAHEILQKYQASFLVEEVLDPFTKSVSVCFDHLGRVPRPEPPREGSTAFPEMIPLP
jgi:signal transduction histidine kinase